MCKHKCVDADSAYLYGHHPYMYMCVCADWQVCLAVTGSSYKHPQRPITRNYITVCVCVRSCFIHTLHANIQYMYVDMIHMYIACLHVLYVHILSVMM